MIAENSRAHHRHAWAVESYSSFHNKKMWFRIKDMDPWTMDVLLELLLELLILLLLYVPDHVRTREPPCNARNKVELQERTSIRKHLYETFKQIVL